jgi:hypothetical protein
VEALSMGQLWKSWRRSAAGAAPSWKRGTIMKKAIGTIIIGDRYRVFWQQICEPSWRHYAQNHGYEVVVIDQPIQADCGKRSIHWQKLLLLEAPQFKGFDRVVWLDSDILINPAAPSVIEGVPMDKIGVTLYGDLTDNMHSTFLERWKSAFRERGLSPTELDAMWPDYYRRVGLESDPSVRFNTGVLVLTPDLHREFMRKVFDAYSDNALDYEQTYLNYELCRHNSYSLIDQRFNAAVGDELIKRYPFLFFMDDEIERFKNNTAFLYMAQFCLLALHDNNHFIHFCGARWPAALMAHALKSFTERDFRKLARNVYP